MTDWRKWVLADEVTWRYDPEYWEWQESRARSLGRMTERLAAEGWAARVTCDLEPVQIEGTLPTGESFYFRCRYDTCALNVGPVSSAPDDARQRATWGATVARWTAPYAGWIDAAEAEAVLRELVGAYPRR